MVVAEVAGPAPALKMLAREAGTERHRVLEAPQYLRAVWWLLMAVLTVCGLGAGVALGAAHSSRTAGSGLMWLMFVGSSVHVAATFSVVGDPKARRIMSAHRSRLIVLPVVLTATAVLVTSNMPAQAVSVSLLAFFAWQLLHYQKQNLGLAALAARSFGARAMTIWQRRCLVVVGVAAIGQLIGDPALFQIHGLWGSQVPIEGVAAGLFAGASLWGGLLLIGRGRSERSPAFVTAYALALLFPLPMFVFSSPYAGVGGMTIAHGLQYLLVVGTTAFSRGRGPDRAMYLARAAVAALLGGWLISVMSHFDTRAGGTKAIFGVYLGLVMAHFVLDARLWRVRDAKSREFVT
ncbi:MAG TPA: hypothetical protein VFN61_08225, partial [Acidimicrobiales bacterium]|nr:hypothetical protein [Acidimicrobiales bacterium]